MIFPCPFGIELILQLLFTALHPLPQPATPIVPSPMFDPQASDEPPPPSYELSQEVFDQKTRQGIQESLEPLADAPDLWEEWDEAKFEANARTFAETQSSSSSSAPSLPPVTAQQYPKEKTPRPPSPPPPQQEEPAVRPLRIVKKSQSAAYKKAVEASSYQSNTLPGGPAPSSDEGASLARNFSVLSMGRRTPPPMFQTIGPSLDGPDYDEVIMSYVPGDSRPSSPVSVLSTDSYRPPDPPPPQLAESRPNRAAPPPRPPFIQHQPAPRTVPQQRPQHQPPRRRVGFDPMSAYKSKSAFTPGLDPTPERIDPSSFYKWVPLAASICPVSKCLLIHLQFRGLIPPFDRSPALNNHSNVSGLRDVSAVNAVSLTAAHHDTG